LVDCTTWSYWTTVAIYSGDSNTPFFMEKVAGIKKTFNCSLSKGQSYRARFFRDIEQHNLGCR
jgi:hypothetical protein